MKQSLKWKILLIACFLLVACTRSSSSFRSARVDLKVIDLEGHSLSGFHIYRGEKKIGRTNSFGEWSYSFSIENADPFFLTLETGSQKNDFAKRIKVTLEKKRGGNYSFEKVVRVPRSSIGLKGVLSSEKDHVMALKVQEFFSSVHFNFEFEKFEKKNDKLDLKSLQNALKNEALSRGLYYQFSSEWQVFIGPSSKGSKWIKVTSRVPLEVESLSFLVEKENSSKSLAQRIFSHLRKKVHYPYRIEKIKNDWFVRIDRMEQKSFWRIDRSIKLKVDHSYVSIEGHREKGNARSYLYPITEKLPFLCSSPKKTSCYLYSGFY